MQHKLVRITTVPISLEKLLSGQLRFMGQHYQVTAVSAGNETLQAVGQQENCDIFALDMTRKITPIRDFLAVIRLYFFLRKLKPQIVHTHTPKAGIVGMLAAKWAGVPVRLHTVAGLPLLEAKGIKRRLLSAVEKLTYRCATKVYPNSFGLLQIIKSERFCPSEKLKVLGNGSSNGIDTGYFDPELVAESQKKEIKQQLQLEAEDFVFLFIGRLVKDKGLQELVCAFEKLQQESRQVKLLLVGGFEPELDPLPAATMHSIYTNKSIIRTGFQSDVRPYLSVSDVLVFPSYREGFPNVVMQAGAMALPCIVSDINGCNEIITDQVNGLVIPVKSETAVYQAMKNVLANPALRAHMQQQSRESITTRYGQKMFWEALLAEYRTFDTHQVG